MTKKTFSQTLMRSAALAALAVAFAAAPAGLKFGGGKLVQLGHGAAFAKDGGDDRGGDDSGGGRGGGGNSGRGGGDDSGGGNSGRGGGDDRGGGNSGRGGGDDRGGSNSGRGGGDDRGGSNSGRGGGNDDRGGDDRGGDDAHEVTMPDGTRIEIENGRFQRKNARGRTIEERPATARDRALLNRARAKTASVPQRTRTGGGGLVAKLEVSGRNIEVTYTDGWREEIENGRYELKDNLNRTVVERPATQSDRSRLFSAVR